MVSAAGSARRGPNPAALAMMLLAWTSVASAHPIHTTIADLGYQRDARLVRVTIRVFDDDFGRAVLGLPATASAPADAAVNDAAAQAYVRAHFTLAGTDGRPVALTWCGLRRSANLVWVCVEASWAGDPRTLRVHNELLFELYRDQINIVQASLGGTTSSLLFTRGDGPKPVS